MSWLSSHLILPKITLATPKNNNRYFFLLRSTKTRDKNIGGTISLLGVDFSFNYIRMSLIAYFICENKHDIALKNIIMVGERHFVVVEVSLK